jgi:hypothetical protein
MIVLNESPSALGVLLILKIKIDPHLFRGNGRVANQFITQLALSQG